jgi:hypothetical protein
MPNLWLGKELVALYLYSPHGAYRENFTFTFIIDINNKVYENKREVSHRQQVSAVYF